MTPDVPTSLAIPERHAESIGRVTRYFMGIALLMVSIAIWVSWLLMRFIGRSSQPTHYAFPPAFAVSTLLLVTGSVLLHRARQSVAQERQHQFLLWLWCALVAGALFMGVQSYGLWAMFPPERPGGEASLGVRPYVIVLAGLHGLHFVVAVLFVSFVTARALAHRYDHEYHWGVVVCEWFWHVLGIVWLGILAVFAITLTTL